MRKLDRSGGSTGSAKSIPQNRLIHAWNAMDKGGEGRYQVQAAWVRDPGAGAGGAWLGGTGISAADLAYAGDPATGFGNGGRFLDGTLKGVPVRMFSARIRAVGSAKPLVGFVAVQDTGGAGGKGMALGLLMLVVGSLAVGIVAYVVAAGHA